ncbi:MAG: ABC transporter substrate-binding protein [Thermomicrobiales bacterium]
MNGEVTPWIGDSYTYNDGFTECTVKIKSGVTWNDGQPYTADDIVFSQNLLLQNPALNGAAAVQRDIASVTALDSQTVLFTLTNAIPRFHSVGVLFPL